MECLNHKYMYGSSLEAPRLAINVAGSKQIHIRQHDVYWRP